MRLLARDKAILGKLAACKWLTTSQLQRLFFAGISLDFVRKRLRKLAQGGYLKRFQPDHMSEALHGLGSPPKQVGHLIGINEIRIAAEKEGCEFFYAHWELGKFDWAYPVIPDAVCKRGELYLIEYDTGNEARKQLKEKFAMYACFDFPYTLMLVADTVRRLATLQAITRVPGIDTRALSVVLDDIRGGLTERL